MESLLFGTAGVPVSSKGHSSSSGIKRIYELGLGCMELQFLHEVRMGERTARTVSKAAKDLDIKLSVHAPYYINFNAVGGKLIKYKEMVMQSARIGSICGAENVVVHAGSYGEDPPQAVYRKIKNILKDMQKQLKKENVNITLRVETTEKNSQFGSLEEVLALAELNETLPCIDFPHLHKMTGKCNSREEFIRVLEQVEDRLGNGGLKNMYIHASGIEPSEKLRKKYFVSSGSYFKFKELASVLSDFDIKGLVISGSPNLESDALALKREYERGLR
jgi:deoxyribonuclease IV